MEAVISGNIRPGFEAVREAFAQNFEKRNEVGASVAVVRNGQYLVDLWGVCATSCPKSLCS